MDASVFGAALLEVEAALDWELLGKLYCHEGGGDFFPEEQREAIREAGLRLADDLFGPLAGLPQDTPGRSLYVGAGVAELAPVLCESLVLGREVHWLNLVEDEVAELRRAIEQVATQLDVRLPVPRVAPVRSVRAPLDHVWLVSVLSDPETYPALSAQLYSGERRRALTANVERREAQQLLRDLLGRLSARALLTTTDEELTLIEPLIQEAGAHLQVPETARLSGIVGDPVRVCRVRRGRRRRAASR